MATNPDFRDLFVALSDAGAEYLVVGAHAVMFYTEPRSTGSSCATSSDSLHDPEPRVTREMPHQSRARVMPT